MYVLAPIAWGQTQIAIFSHKLCSVGSLNYSCEHKGKQTVGKSNSGRSPAQNLTACARPKYAVFFQSTWMSPSKFACKLNFFLETCILAETCAAFSFECLHFRRKHTVFSTFYFETYRNTQVFRQNMEPPLQKVLKTLCFSTILTRNV